MGLKSDLRDCLAQSKNGIAKNICPFCVVKNISVLLSIKSIQLEQLVVFTDHQLEQLSFRTNKQTE
jgi:hypothetical protein